MLQEPRRIRKPTPRFARTSEAMGAFLAARIATGVVAGIAAMLLSAGFPPDAGILGTLFIVGSASVSLFIIGTLLALPDFAVFAVGIHYLQGRCRLLAAPTYIVSAAIGGASAISLLGSFYYWFGMVEGESWLLSLFFSLATSAAGVGALMGGVMTLFGSSRWLVLPNELECQSCGYDLRGSPPGGDCPECGAKRVAS